VAGRGGYHLATATDRCLHVGAVAPNRSFTVGRVASTAAAGTPTAWKVGDGPITVAGAPTVEADITTVGTDVRVFAALSVGTSPATARVVQGNLLPIRIASPVSGLHATVALPAIAVEVPAGESLFLTLSPLSDVSFGHGSRTPGAMVLDHTVVHVPVV
jgi:hypothetical protein